MSTSIRLVLLSIGFSTLIAMLDGCKKEPSVIYVDEYFKEWSLFRRSSYWVYLNESTMIEDSSFISKDPQYSYFGQEKAKKYEYIEFSIENGFIKNCYLGSGQNNSSGLSMTDFYSGNRCFSNWLILGKEDRVTTSCRLIHVYNYLTLNNNTFNNVYHTRDSNKTSTSYTVKDYYFAKNIGLIKFSIRTPEIDSTWSLVRWHVVQ